MIYYSISASSPERNRAVWAYSRPVCSVCLGISAEKLQRHDSVHKYGLVIGIVVQLYVQYGFVATLNEAMYTSKV